MAIERVIEGARRALCRFRGHDNLLHFKHNRMYLQCATCGYESPGWSLSEKPPTVIAHGTRRAAFTRIPVGGARRIA